MKNPKLETTYKISRQVTRYIERQDAKTQRRLPDRSLTLMPFKPYLIKDIVRPFKDTLRVLRYNPPEKYGTSGRIRRYQARANA